MHLTAAQLVVALAVMVFGGFVQGIIGFGSSLIAVPIVGLMQPKAVPGAFFLVSLPLTVFMAFHEREHIDWTGVRWMLTGRVPATLVGLVLLAVLDAPARLAAVGIVVLAGTLASAVAPPIPLTRANRIAAGTVTGVTGTIAGIDGPPLALLYRHSRPEVVRPTLSVMFAIGGLLSIAVALPQGVVHVWHLALSAVLVPALFAGLALARPVRHRVPLHAFRIMVLVVAGLAGVSAVLRGLLG